MKMYEADIVVIAAGMSGLAAAVTAAERGLSVIVLEKSSTSGGAGNMGRGFFAVGSRVQRRQYDYLTADDAFRQFMEYTHWRSDARLVRKYLNLTADTVEWVQGMGVEILAASKYFMKSYETWHLIKVPGVNKSAPRSASVLAKGMTQRAEELGVKFFYQTPAKKVLLENGYVTGVQAMGAEGEPVQVDCSCAIIATGGIGDNPEMIKEYLGFEWGKDIFTFRLPGLTGDGIRMAWECGAGEMPIHMEIIYNTPGITDIYAVISETMREPNLVVNQHGIRIMNEEELQNTTYTGNIILQQKGRCIYTILNDELVEYYKHNGRDFRTVRIEPDDMDEWASAVEEYLSGEINEEKAKYSVINVNGTAMSVDRHFFVCETLEEVADETGIDVCNLRATLEEYNRYCDGGYDPVFNKPARFLRPIRGGKYYVARHYPSGYGSLGGIKVNENLEVITKEEEKIPGLYACGTDACNIFGDSYDFYLPGSTMGFALNSGRIAASSAADYLHSDEFFDA